MKFLCLWFLGWLLTFGAWAQTKNYFESLKLPNGASQVEIQAKFKALMAAAASDAERDEYYDAINFLSVESQRLKLTQELKAHQQADQILEGAMPTASELHFMELSATGGLNITTPEQGLEVAERMWCGPQGNGKLLNEVNFIATFFLLSEEKRIGFYKRYFFQKHIEVGFESMLLIASKVYDSKQIYFEKFKKEFTVLFGQLLTFYYEDPEKALGEMISAMYQTHVLNSFHFTDRFDASYPFQDYVYNQSSEQSYQKLKDSIRGDIFALTDDFNQYQLGRLLTDIAVELSSIETLKALIKNEENNRIRLLHLQWGDQYPEAVPELKRMLRYTQAAVIKVGGPAAFTQITFKGWLKQIPRTLCNLFLAPSPMKMTDFPKANRYMGY
ncbi:MAG: hypothetical protein JNM93_08130 [Bacteriovoracaceae bacterium]|nr:hypothetical protein [Bacteriovoracaceae bacterium]